MIDIILDIETLGTNPGCPIIEIGACAMDPSRGAIVGNFSRRVNCGLAFADVVSVADGQNLQGWNVDRDTAKWWTGDTERAKTLKTIMSAEYHPDGISRALMAFSEWFEDSTRDVLDVRIWANGPSFDIAILDHAYCIDGLPCPWIYWQEYCVRTALEMSGYVRGSIAWAEAGPRHRALNDARHEAKKLWLSGALGTISEVTKRLRQRGTLPQ